MPLIRLHDDASLGQLAAVLAQRIVTSRAAAGWMRAKWRVHLAAIRAMLVGLIACHSLQLSVAATDGRRLLTAEDINALREISDPQLSPDGAWVAYAVRTADSAKDKWSSHLWMSRWDGAQSLQLTYWSGTDRAPCWSPDGRYLAFLRTGGEGSAFGQVWLLDRRGGEARPLTSFSAEVLDLRWSPDGKKLALIVADEDVERHQADDGKAQPPIVIDRYQFKDATGYLGTQRQHLYLFDVATRQAINLTPGRFDESLPSWSPDGSRIAFFSKRGDDPDRSNEFGLYTVEPRAGAEPRLLTTLQGGPWMAPPQWQPNGRAIAFLTAGDPKLLAYSVRNLATVPAAGGTPHLLTTALDRNVLQPRWSADGRSLYFLLEDDRNQRLTRMATSTGKIETVMSGRRQTFDYDLGRDGRIALLDSTVAAPAAVYALEKQGLRALSHQNDDWLNSVRLAATEEISFPSQDGTRVRGFLVKPAGHVPGQRLPTLLWIHGGPVAQYTNSFMLLWQIFASQGYAVVAANPRGSSGRGESFSTAIYRDWGSKDSDDVLAAMDEAVRQGVADPARLGVGGWSYGGILTNVVIAKDQRFKSATSGASLSNMLAGYGTDMFPREYEVELGMPWKELDAYLRNSYAFMHADRIRTPTLFLSGDQDFSVPLLHSEQMYQSLRSLGVPTQLVIYPGEHHDFIRPSYLQDRVQRYLDWHGKYLRENS